MAIEGINWDNLDLNKINPFTGLAVTQGDISKVDGATGEEGRDGNLTREEWEAVSSSYIASVDDEGVASLGDGTDFLTALQGTEGVKEFVDTTTEFEEQLTIYANLYQETYFAANTDLNDEEKAEIIQIINNIVDQFKATYESQFTEGVSVDMKSISAMFELSVRKELDKINEAKLKSISLNTINPYTGLGVTAADIAEVDQDGNGILDEAEWEKAKAKYAVSFGDEDLSLLENGSSFLTTLSSTEGIKEFVKTKDELKEQLELIAEVFQEDYFNNHYGMTDEEKAFIKKLITTTKDQFVKDYGAKIKKAGSLDLKSIAAMFEITIEKAVASNAEQQEMNNQKIDGYTDYKDSALLDLFELTISANENENISVEEFNKMKGAALKYLMGMLLSGDIDESLIDNLGGSKTKYSQAKAKIDSIEKMTDPEQIKKALEEAEKLLNEYLNSFKDRDAFAKGILDLKAAKAEDAARAVLDKYKDKYFERHVTKDMTDEEREYLKKFLDCCENKFIAKMAEDGSIEGFNEKTIGTNFESYIRQQLQELTRVQTRAVETASEIMDNFNSLIEIQKKAKENGNISEDEKAQLVDGTTKLIMSQLMMGVDTLVLLDKIDPSYKTTEEWGEISDILDKLKTSVDPDELKGLQDRAAELVKQLLNKYDGDKISNAIDYIKPVELSDKNRDKALMDSELYSYYAGAGSKSGGYGKQNDGSLAEITSMAMADLKTFAESMKKQLQKEYGDAYNEADVEKYINDAINDTIAIFQAGKQRRHRDGNAYFSGADERGFIFERRSGTKKGRYVYNVKALIDTFQECFNITSQQKNPTKLDPSLATYDVENAIYAAEGLGSDYFTNKSETVSGSSQNDSGAYAQLIEQARKELKALGEQIKVSLAVEGLNVPDSIVDEWIEDCIFSTIEDMKNAFQYAGPGSVPVGGWGAAGLGTLAAGGTYLGIAGAGGAVAAGIGATVAGTTTAAVSAATSMGVTGAISGATYATSAGTITGAQIATANTVAAAVPIAGLIIAGVSLAGFALSQWTNLFGATWGQHNADAGFYFERKSNSHSGRFGYDTQTLVNLFLNKFNEKLDAWKKEEKDKKTDAENITK